MKMRLTRAQSSEPDLPDGPGPIRDEHRDMADYIADMTLQLSRMARSAGLTTVMVPLEFAYYEAFAAANKVEIPPEELRYLKSLDDACRSFTGTPDGTDTQT